MVEVVEAERRVFDGDGRHRELLPPDNRDVLHGSIAFRDSTELFLLYIVLPLRGSPSLHVAAIGDVIRVEGPHARSRPLPFFALLVLPQFSIHKVGDEVDGGVFRDRAYAATNDLRVFHKHGHLNFMRALLDGGVFVDGEVNLGALHEIFVLFKHLAELIVCVSRDGFG
eukprot:CAMPEP_0185276342 /NCGR_PEP_ID=MMETSP1359-20130426/55986_1 /TAXON_ID=552665 /ORGANISM="Bigelowiella longifila, Strain CCMP242" /LENGTH=168 /DNA_ID=CAMNT_0027869985 /DNA_START=510 /DNA_END=1016 /DNA_ORIENTATION=+